MDRYKLEIKQIVDYPRCRICREFIQSLIADRSIRTGGNSGFSVLPFSAHTLTSALLAGGGMGSHTIYL